MNFDSYVREMKRLGWNEDELRKDYELEKTARENGVELPWFPVVKSTYSGKCRFSDDQTFPENQENESGGE